MWPLRNKKWRFESSMAALLEMFSLWHRGALFARISLILIFRCSKSLGAEKMKRKYEFVVFFFFFWKQSKTLHGLSKWYSVVLWVIKDQIDWLRDLKVRSLVFAFVLNHGFIKCPAGDLTAKIIHAGDAVCKTVCTQEILFCGAPSGVKSLIQWQLS